MAGIDPAHVHGVTEFVNLSEAPDNQIGRRRRDAIFSELVKLEGSDLRRAVLNLTFGGVPVGRQIYDGYLRDFCRATIDHPDDMLSDTIQTAAAFYAMMG